MDWEYLQLQSTAHSSNKYLGYATICHPFHPFSGKSFKILFTRKSSDGKYFLSLDNTKVGSLYVPIDWTDKAEPRLYDHISVSERPILSYTKLQELSKLIKKIKRRVDL